jgi:hypothetical protein
MKERGISMTGKFKGVVKLSIGESKLDSSKLTGEVVQADEPSDPVQRANWLPAPEGDFSLYVRAYWPKVAVTDGSWTLPAAEKMM